MKCFSEPDAGIDDGYNKAISHATGKYVFFMNSDDQYYADDVIEKCIEIMEESRLIIAMVQNTNSRVMVNLCLNGDQI